jgi:hypothetical protein
VPFMGKVSAEGCPPVVTKHIDDCQSRPVRQPSSGSHARVDEFSLSISMRWMPMFSAHAGLPDLEERATLPGQQPQGHGIVQLDLSDQTAPVMGASAGIGAVIAC